MWLPSPPSLAVPIPALLDDEAAALASAPIVLIEYREDAPQDGGKSVQDDERAARGSARSGETEGTEGTGSNGDADADGQSQT